jgi:hypothetical protein
MRAVFRLDLLLWTVHLFFLDDREMFLFHFCVGCNCALSSVVGIFLFFMMSFLSSSVSGVGDTGAKSRG